MEAEGKVKKSDPEEVLSRLGRECEGPKTNKSVNASVEDSDLTSPLFDDDPASPLKTA